MRKLEKEMCKAIREGVAWRGENTHVSIYDDGERRVYSYNALLCCIKPHKTGYLVSVGGSAFGYFSSTTTSRLRAVLNTLRIQKHGDELFIFDGEEKLTRDILSLQFESVDIYVKDI